MRIVLLILGGSLLLQTALDVARIVVNGPFSFEAVGMQLDEDMVQLTAGLCAVSLAHALWRKKI